MEPFRWHAFVCKQTKQEGIPSCEASGAGAVLTAFLNEIDESGIGDEVQVTTCGCLGICGRGPNVVVYPGGTWYSGVGPDQVKLIVNGHFINNTPVEELTIKDSGTAKLEILEHRKRVSALFFLQGREALLIFPPAGSCFFLYFDARTRSNHLPCLPNSYPR